MKARFCAPARLKPPSHFVEVSRLNARLPLFKMCLTLNFWSLQMLHYYAKNFFSPVIASAYEEDGKFKLYVVSDLLQVNVNTFLSYSDFSAM